MQRYRLFCDLERFGLPGQLGIPGAPGVPRVAVTNGVSCPLNTFTGVGKPRPSGVFAGAAPTTD
jgi:hypothetical protein